MFASMRLPFEESCLFAMEQEDAIDAALFEMNQIH